MLASAGDSMFARAGVKALQGAAQGAAGSAALVPGDWWLHTKDGQDYTMADALKSVVMGGSIDLDQLTTWDGTVQHGILLDQKIEFDLGTEEEEEELDEDIAIAGILAGRGDMTRTASPAV